MLKKLELGVAPLPRLADPSNINIVKEHKPHEWHAK